MRRRGFLTVALLVTALLAGVVSYWASSAPDGLTRVAVDLGFASSEEPHASSDSPLAGYATSGVDATWLSGAIAGVVGVAVCFVIAALLGRAARRRRDDKPGRRP